MKKCLFDGAFGAMHCHTEHAHHNHAEGHGHGHHHHHGHHHGHHPDHHAFHLFGEIVGPKYVQLERVIGQLNCPELSHTQLMVVHAEIKELCAGKHNKHSIRHALHHFYRELGVHHTSSHNPYIVFGPIVAQKIKHLKLEMHKLQSALMHKHDSMNQQKLFTESFHLAFAHLGRMINDLNSCDLTVKRLEHIKHEVESLSHRIHQCTHHFYGHIGGFGKHIDASIVGMAEGLKMQWRMLKEKLHQKEIEIIRA